MTLMKKLAAGTLALASLAGCGVEKFNDSKWIEAPFTREIWTPYMGENIHRDKGSWGAYQEMVAQRNGLKYEERNGVIYIIGYDKKTILLPDLDEKNGVEIKLNGIRTRVD